MALEPRVYSSWLWPPWEGQILPSLPGLTAHSTGAVGSTRWEAWDQLRPHLQARSNGMWHTCLPENKVPFPGVCPPQLVTGHPSVSLATALPTSWQELPRLLIGSFFSGQPPGQVHPSPWEWLSPPGSAVPAAQAGSFSLIPFLSTS